MTRRLSRPLIVAAAFLFAVAGTLPAQPDSKETTHLDWDLETYKILSGADPEEIERVELEGDEKLDRINNRAVEAGRYELMRLLDLPTYDLVVESLEKRLELEERRALLEGAVAENVLDLGLKPAVEEEAVEDQGFRMVSSGFLEVDVDGRTVVSTDRTEVNFQDFRLEADRMMIDVQAQQIHAAGNVEFEDMSSGSTTYGDALIYDFDSNVGQMTNSSGEQGIVRIVPNPDSTDLRTFQQLSEREAVFTSSSLTTDNFPKPMYRIKGTEVVFLRNDRFFVYHAVLYVREFPLFYFPVYTRNIGDEVLPWSLRFGRSTGGERELDNYAILSYDYYHRDIEPSLNNPGTYEQRSLARISPFFYWAGPGNGVGVDGRYDFNRSQHKGEIFAFYSGEHDDRANDLPLEDEERYFFDFKHRTELGHDLDIMFNVDWISDSEVYNDYFDEILPDQERGRLAERRALTALTWTKDDYLARVTLEVKDRLGRDRVNNFPEPGDDDEDYDQFVLDDRIRVDEEGNPIPITPEELEALDDLDADLDEDEEQIDRDRFGRVTERKPEFTFATSRLPIFNKDIFWTFDFRAFNNLDKGLNVIDEDDDSFVRGFDAYNSLVGVINFSEQYSWYHKVGVGFGRAEREDNEFNVFEDVENAEAIEFPFTLNNGLTFVDPETFLVGTREFSLDDVSENFVYADYESLFRAEFSEKLEGRLRYRIREGTDDHIGEFYNSIGATAAREDLFDFRMRQHRVDGNLVYDFIYPRIRLELNGGYNFDSGDDLTPNESISFLTAGGQWKSLDNEWTLSTTAGVSETQIRDTSDPFEFQARTFTWIGQVDYFPVHERYWALFRGSYFKDLEDDPIDEFIAESVLDPDLGEEDRDAFFEDDDTNYNFEGVVGARVGPKYEVELQARYDEEEEDFDRIQLIFLRDLNDATLSFGITWELEDVDDENDEEEFDEFDDDFRDREFEREVSFDFGLNFKLPNRDRFAGPLATEVVVSNRRSEIELGG